MRAYLLGFLGGPTALLLVGAVVLAVRQVQGSEGARRAALLRQIDEYERWYDGLGRERPSELDLSLYIAYHPEFGRYFVWWRNAVLEVDQPMAARARPADLRDPRWLDRYLAFIGSASP